MTQTETDLELELLKDPKTRGREHAFGILDHFESFATGEDGAKFKPTYFTRTDDPLDTMSAVFWLLGGAEGESAPVSIEPKAILELNGIVLACQTRIIDGQPVDDYMWAQPGNEPLNNPFVPIYTE